MGVWGWAGGCSARAGRPAARPLPTLLLFLLLLQAWLDEHVDAVCAHEVLEVQEDFAHGVAAELTRVRAAEKVATHSRAAADAARARASGLAGDLDARLRVTEGAGVALKAGQAAAAKAGAALRGAGARALENERVATAATAVGGGLAAGWKWTSKIAGEGVAKLTGREAPTVIT